MERAPRRIGNQDRSVDSGRPRGSEARRRNQDAEVEGTRCGGFRELWNGVDPRTAGGGAKKDVKKILDDTGVSDAVDVYEAFGGVYDLSLRRHRWGSSTSGCFPWRQNRWPKTGLTLQKEPATICEIGIRFGRSTAHVAQLIKDERAA